MTERDFSLKHIAAAAWLTSQQVRQQGPTLLRNGVIPFSNVLK